MSMKSGSDWALALLRTLPRVGLMNLPREPFRKHPRTGRGQHGGKLHGGPQKGSYQRMSYPRLGWEPRKVPWYVRVPMENYYKDHHLKRQYPPLSLGTLQLLIDTNRISTDEPIDLTAICNTKLHEVRPQERHYGFHLTVDGIDTFKAKVNIEVQWTSEAVIAAVEKNGGTITTSYYDLHSIYAAKDPIAWFRTGKPIPKRMIPPEDAIEFYTNPKMRGYLADPEKVAEERLVLAQKYGYELPKIEEDPQRDLLLKRKDPRQIFYGLEPGWVVNLRDKCILKPKDEALLQYYSN
ncbi:unnamed protein product [Orchesella dallaii]|uniref:Large ribosomal subunit protein uL15m n=1 Tax=Orchesella dallaii TaxID=48710 RepID=A0ABP1PLQ3_9HEXA